MLIVSPRPKRGREGFQVEREHRFNADANLTLHCMGRRPKEAESGKRLPDIERNRPMSLLKAAEADSDR